MATITIFGSAFSTEDSYEWKKAFNAGRILSGNGINIATGGYKGVMEAASKGCGDSSTDRIGVILEDSEPNPYINKVVKTNSYFERLIKLIEIGDSYLVLPGGSGTLLEIAAVWALKDRNLLGDKIIVTIGDMWNEIKQIIGFYNENIVEHFDTVYCAESLDEALNLLINHLKETGKL